MKNIFLLGILVLPILSFSQTRIISIAGSGSSSNTTIIQGGDSLWGTNAAQGGITNIIAGGANRITNDIIALGTSRFVGNGVGLTNLTVTAEGINGLSPEFAEVTITGGGIMTGSGGTVRVTGDLNLGSGDFVYDVANQKLTLLGNLTVDSITLGDSGMTAASNSDIEFLNEGNGIILHDRTTPANKYRIYVNGGVLLIEGPL